MALQKVGEKALQAVQVHEPKIVERKPKKTVLDEETHADNVEKIIVRDFFPDLPKLEAQADYIDALQRKDTERLRQIHLKYGSQSGTVSDIYSTPATFETPQTDTARNPADRDKDDDQPTHNPEPSEEKKQSFGTLDQYLSKHTSEDNASFEGIMEEAEAKQRLKHAWLYEQKEEKAEDCEKALALPSVEEQAKIGSSSSLQGWTYQPRNALMYVPEGTALSAKESIEAADNQKEIVHKNTAFKTKPFNNTQSQATIQEAASNHARTLHGKIGPDGKELLPTQSPKVNGYGFMSAMPSPAPGVDASPLMTWGEIEGTPFRLDGSDTPMGQSTPGPIFRIPDVPTRDIIGMRLAENASKAHRAKKQQALKQVQSRFSTPSPKFGSSSRSEKLACMSPAAQRLATSKLGIRTSTDKALRASYTPSPSHRLPGDKTPVSLTPSPGGRTPTPGRRTPLTPKSGSSTPSYSNHTPKRTSDSSSITDNLLNLPKRPKASEFF